MGDEYSQLASLVVYMTPEAVHQVSSEGDNVDVCYRL
jgi:hypothetical protein